MTEPGKGDEDTPAALVQGTIRCLQRYGLAGTTSRRIAQESGVNLGGITYHFGSKDELVTRALLEAIRTWLEPALTVLRTDQHPIPRMIAAIQALEESFEKARDMLPVYLEAMVMASRDDSLGQAVRATFAELRAFLTDQTEELRATGFLPAWVDPGAMALLLIAAADGIALHAALDPGSVDHRAVASQAMQLLLAASSRGTPS
jgi:AcrR family transcriptional regulator